MEMPVSSRQTGLHIFCKRSLNSLENPFRRNLVSIVEGKRKAVNIYFFTVISEITRSSAVFGRRDNSSSQARGARPGTTFPRDNVVMSYEQGQHSSGVMVPSLTPTRDRPTFQRVALRHQGISGLLGQTRILQLMGHHYWLH